MNDVTFLEASRKLAERMMHEGGSTPDERIDYGFPSGLWHARPKPAKQRGAAGQLTSFDLELPRRPKAAEKYLSYGESPRDNESECRRLAAYTTRSQPDLESGRSGNEGIKMDPYCEHCDCDDAPALLWH